MKMSERFDILFEGMNEDTAIDFLNTENNMLKNPGIKYLAASRLGACKSENSLVILRRLASQDTDNLYDKITKRKAIDAIGRRKDTESIPILLKCLEEDDEPAVINAADSIGRIGKVLDNSDQQVLAGALNGSDNQKRAIIQAFSRLGLKGILDKTKYMQDHNNPLVAGAAIAYNYKVGGNEDMIDSLVSQLIDRNAGRRRSAVIDLGDSGYVGGLKEISRAPVSMPLRIRSILQICKINNISTENTPECLYIEQTLKDDPCKLNILEEWNRSIKDGDIISQLKHRDEGHQYAAARYYLEMNESQRNKILDLLVSLHGDDYGVHYFIIQFIGKHKIEERADMVREALKDDSPQYTKSRIAAAWTCVELKLFDQQAFLKQLKDSSTWKPLQWACNKAHEELDLMSR